VIDCIHSPSIASGGVSELAFLFEFSMEEDRKRAFVSAINRFASGMANPHAFQLVLSNMVKN
jgi:hypothetical protein